MSNAQITHGDMCNLVHNFTCFEVRLEFMFG